MSSRMLSRLASAIVTSAALSSPLAAQTPFEGNVTMRITSEGRTVDMTYALKGARLRMDMPLAGRASGANAMYMVREGDRLSMVMPAQKMYIEQPISAGGMAGRAGARGAAKVAVTPTGKTETVAGYPCEHYSVTSDEGQYDVCLAKGIGNFTVPTNPMAGRGAASGGSDRVLEQLGATGFPLRVQKAGGETILEVTKIERKPLDDALFAVPSDFRKVDFSRMGRPPGDR